MTRVLYNPYDWGLNLTKQALAIGAELSGDPAWGTASYIRGEIDEGFRHSEILLTVFGLLGSKTSRNILEICEVGGDRYAIEITYDDCEKVWDVEDFDWVSPKPVEEDTSPSEVEPKKIVKTVHGGAVTLTPQMIELGKLLSKDPEWCCDASGSWTLHGRFNLPKNISPSDPVLVKVVELLDDCKLIKVYDVSFADTVCGGFNTIFDDLVWKDVECTSRPEDWFKDG